MRERSIWMAVLQDITEVIPIRGVLHVFPTMLSSELEHKAMMMARIDELWSRGTVHPAKIDRYPVDSDVSTIVLLFGGDFILTLVKDGTLQLCHTQDVTKLLVTVPPPYRPSNRHYFPNYTDVRRSRSSCGEIWVLVGDYYNIELE
jgi:hypothetical protein